jgi:hypothetical protein
MADKNSNRFRSKGANATGQANSKDSGFTVDAGPYVAVVVGHVKGSRLGQLKVTIPDWTNPGDQIPEDGIPVTYASPFYGRTFGTDTQQVPNTPATAGQSYGFWAVPPDIGCKVLVTFARGDLSEGYWFACVYDSPSHHMVPGIARNIGGTNNTAVPNDIVGSRLVGNSVVPVVEYATSDPDAFTGDGLVNTDRFPHEYQMSVLMNQGLDRDKIRGAISSSSMRESPSNVFGMSTPGAKGTKADQVPSNPDAVFFRKGGHQFVMDDGDKDGNDQLIRLRTSGGHQILMNDKEHVLYIASDSGYQWMEFSKNGSINVYGAGGINMRSEGPINMHSDASVNIQGAAVSIVASGGKGLAAVGNAISLKSMGSVGISAVTMASIKSNATLTLSCMGMASLKGLYSVDVGSYGVASVSGSLLKLNTPPGISGIPPLPVLPPALGSHQDTSNDGTNWIVEQGALQSCCTVVPAHEPWVDADGNRPKPSSASLAASLIAGVL